MPKYEREWDRKRERTAIRLFDEQTGSRTIPAKNYSRGHYLWWSEELDSTDMPIACPVDVHCRKTQYFQSAKRDGYMLGLRKWKQLQHYGRNSPCGLVLLVAWGEYETHSDISIFRMMATRVWGAEKYPERYQGRTIKTRDNDDYEMCVFIPLENFDSIYPESPEFPLKYDDQDRQPKVYQMGFQI